MTMSHGGRHAVVPQAVVPRRGLSSAEAASRLTADGPNVLPAPHPVPLWRRVVAQLRDPLVLVLLVAAVLTTATTQLAVALGSRARPGTLANPMLPAAVAVALALQFAGLYLPFLQELLHTEPLTGLDLLVVFLASTLGYAAIRLDRILFRRNFLRPPASGTESTERKAPRKLHAQPFRCPRSISCWMSCSVISGRQ